MSVIIFASTTKINQKPNGNGRYIIRHDNSIIFIRNTSRRFAHKSQMAVASTFNSMEMNIPRTEHSLHTQLVTFVIRLTILIWIIVFITLLSMELPFHSEMLKVSFSTPFKNNDEFGMTNKTLTEVTTYPSRKQAVI
jgi:hypothetical protein